jgi:hypothetical protein
MLCTRQGRSRQRQWVDDSDKMPEEGVGDGVW